MYRSLWGLPGGWVNYRVSLAKMGTLAKDSHTVDELGLRIVHNFQTVASMSTARGYVRYVLRPLGVLETDSGGRVLAVNSKLSSGGPITRPMLLDRLIHRVEGVAEVLAVVEQGPISIRRILETKEVRQFSWRSDWPVRYRLNWLRAANAVTRLSERESSERYPQWASMVKRSRESGK